MSNFVKNKHNDTIINLDNVTSFTPSFTDNSKVEFKYKIYFTFDSMNDDETLNEVWAFKDESDFASVLSKLEIKEI